MSALPLQVILKTCKAVSLASFTKHFRLFAKKNMSDFILKSLISDSSTFGLTCGFIWKKRKTGDLVHSVIIYAEEVGQPQGFSGKPSVCTHHCHGFTFKILLALGCHPIEGG